MNPNPQPKWSRITDFRDDGIISPLGKVRYEMAVADHVDLDNPPSPPEGATSVWRYDDRWLAE